METCFRLFFEFIEQILSIQLGGISLFSLLITITIIIIIFKFINYLGGEQ